MQQLNILPVNVSQNFESKEGVTLFDSSVSMDDFSQYIDQHLSKNKGVEGDDKVSSVNSEARIVNTHESSTVTKLDQKKSDDLIESSDISDEISPEKHMQEIAASGKNDKSLSTDVDQNELAESEQLMSFLSKVDNTLINQPANSAVITSPEQLSGQQKAHYEAQLLLKSSELVADLSAVAKALGNEQALSEEELFLDAATKEPIATKLPVDSNNSGENKAYVKADNTAGFVKLPETENVLPENNTDSIPKVKVINTASNEMNVTQQNVNSPELSKQVIKDELAINSSANNESNNLISEQKLTKQVKLDLSQASSDNVNHDQLEKEVIDSEQIKAINNTQSKESISVNSIIQVSNTEQVKLNAAQPSEKPSDAIIKQANITQESQHDKVSGLADSQIVKNEVTQVSEGVNNKKSTEVKNQLILNDDEVVKAQIKQGDKEKLESSLIEQSQLKKTADMSNKEQIENKIEISGKRSTLVNSHFIDVSGNATQATQHIIAQQAAEVLNPSVASEVPQSQKTNTQLHQETISILRKDFNEAVKDKVMLMISQKLQQFDITLDPPELGNMQVRVNLQGEQAVVNFLVQSQQTKDALEQNMHKLRDLLSQQGVDVGDANVEQQSNRSANEDGTSDGNHEKRGNQLGNLAEEDDVVAHTLSAKMIDSSTTRVDYYA